MADLRAGGRLIGRLPGRPRPLRRRGAGLVKAAGGSVLAGGGGSGVVYGMPRSVAAAGYVDDVVPLDHIADMIVRRCLVRRLARQRQ